MSDELTIECGDYTVTIEVTVFDVVPPWKGSARTAPSDLDYYGYTDFEYEVKQISNGGVVFSGTDIELPDDIDVVALEQIALEKLNEEYDDGDDYDEDRYREY